MKYWAIYKIGIRQGLEYRIHLWAGLLECFVKIIALVLLWRAMFLYSGTDEMYGYSFWGMVLYSVIARLVLTVAQPTISRVLPEDIKSGTLSQYLLKPVNYFKLRFAEFLGFNTISFFFTYIIGGILIGCASKFGVLNIDLFNVILFGITLINSVILLFLIYGIIGILGFWFIEVGSAYRAYQVFIQIFCGGFIPLTVLGEKIVSIMKYTPFLYILNYPIEVLTDKLELHELFFNYAIQVCWIVILLICINELWKRGIKKYVSACD